MRKYVTLSIAGLAVVWLLASVGCREQKKRKLFPPPLQEARYVTSVTCQICHAATYAEWADSGHKYKLNKVTGGVAPAYPHSSVPDPPSGFTWNDISYVIGGYFWKARFMDSDGYIITGATPHQYHLADSSWTSFYSDPYPPGKVYGDGCGKCHTTGWVASGTEHQDGLPGIEGTWEETGIACEACHGPGSEHILDPNRTNIVKDDSAALCGKCHFRDAQHRIVASSGLIKHHEQYDELLAGPHSALKCITCHDPHKNSVYGGGGVTIDDTCSTCHSGKVSNHNVAATCKDCHMPAAAKSALSFGTGDYLKGDIHSHIFTIDPTKSPAEMFYEDGGTTYAYGFLTVNFSCLGCHDGTTAGLKTVAEAQAIAPFIHP